LAPRVKPGRSGLFVDFDGTFADSLGVLRKAYAAFLEEFGRAATQAEFDSLNGPPLGIVVQRLRDTHGLPGSAEDLYGRYVELLAEQYDAVAAHAGAAELLLSSRAANRPVAIVTSGSETLVRRWLERRGFTDGVAEVVGMERGGRGKPHPDPYLRAMQVLGCDASPSFAVEDSRQGATAACAAGLRTLVVGGPLAERGGWPPIAASMPSLLEVREYLERL
jgi:HAD superfamily hydrolase (TIGR01509 family)